MNSPLDSIIEVLSNHYRNFIIQDLSDDSLTVIEGKVVKCENVLMITGVVMDQECLNELNRNTSFSNYLSSNNLQWLMSSDTAAHYSVIYLIKKES